MGERMEADLRAPRIGAVIGVDPAFGDAFTPASLAPLDQPALLISLGGTGPGSGREAVDIGPGGADLPTRMREPDRQHPRRRACRGVGAGRGLPRAARLSGGALMR